MYYSGGKIKHGQDILNVILDHVKDYDYDTYIEPFCGALGVCNNILGKLKPNTQYIVSDINPHLIRIWSSIRDDTWDPPDSISKQEYDQLPSDSLDKIYLSFACSMRGIYKNTFMHDRNIKKQSSNVRCIGSKLKEHDVELVCCSYDSHRWSNSVIYCDPPYRNTQAHYFNGENRLPKFDYDKFINWCQDMSETNMVFISEYEKPFDACELVWSAKGKSREKLYLVQN